MSEFIIEVVQDRYNSSDPIGIPELLDLLIEEFGVGISLDTFRHYIYRKDNLKIIKGEPMESQRVELDQKQIKAWYQSLAELIKYIPRNFIFNMDESCIEEYVDQQSLSVIVPTSYDEIKIPIQFIVR
jgi:hypothetical protein